MPVFFACRSTRPAANLAQQLRQSIGRETTVVVPGQDRVAVRFGKLLGHAECTQDELGQDRTRQGAAQFGATGLPGIDDGARQDFQRRIALEAAAQLRQHARLENIVVAYLAGCIGQRRRLAVECSPDRVDFAKAEKPQGCPVTAQADSELMRAFGCVGAQDRLDIDQCMRDAGRQHFGRSLAWQQVSAGRCGAGLHCQGRERQTGGQPQATLVLGRQQQARLVALGPVQCPGEELGS